MARHVWQSLDSTQCSSPGGGGGGVISPLCRRSLVSRGWKVPHRTTFLVNISRQKIAKGQVALQHEEHTSDEY